MPLWQNREIENEVHAQFSVSYAFAVEAHGIGLGSEWQEPVNMKSPKIRQFMDKVSAAVHPDHRKPGLEPPTPEVARVEVIAGGKTFVEEGSHAGGPAEAEEPVVKDSDLVEKFKHNASKIIPEGKVDEVVKSIWGLEEIDNISLLMKELARKDA
jgi:2-methylcitrate dehydratase PrpD